MKAKTPAGHEVELKQETVDGRRMRLRGPVIVPGDAALSVRPVRAFTHAKTQ
jgi:hypothetical protein